MDLEKQILSCKNLTPAEQRIGRFILESPSEIITMTGKEMEIRLYVSKSAIYRFCKKIRVEGFNELKLEIASLARGMTDDERIGWVSANLPFMAEDSPVRVCRQLGHLYDQTISEMIESIPEEVLDRVMTICTSHSPIYVFTHQHNSSVAMLFQDKMLLIGYEVIPIINNLAALHVATIMNPESCAIVLSYTGETEYVSEILGILHDRNIESILISRRSDKELKELSTCQITLPGKEMLLERVGQFASDLEVHFILDVIYGCMLNADRARAFYFMDAFFNERIGRYHQKAKEIFESYTQKKGKERQ